MLDKNKQILEESVEFLFERPIGWSSACLDSTIDYYLDCNSNTANTLLEDDNDFLKIDS